MNAKRIIAILVMVTSLNLPVLAQQSVVLPALTVTTHTAATWEAKTRFWRLMEAQWHLEARARLEAPTWEAKTNFWRSR